tara:strand:- start:142770 stop:146180 length:3411 start_codon:yes stop_codon:yes gene_type:complete
MEYKILQTIAMVTKYSLYVFFALFITMSSGLAESVVGQVKSIKEVVINIDESSEKLDQALKTIESQTDFRFFYTDKSIKRNKEITFSEKHGTVADYLLEISGQAGVQFRQVNMTISVSKQEDPQFVGDVEVVLDVQQSINGMVVDETGEGLPGATVLEKGTSNGTITDVDGKFSLSVNENAVLNVSFVGYKSVEVPVNGRTTLSISLEADVAALEEVVVVGYGTQKQVNVTGSVSTVKYDEKLENRPITNASQALGGNASGVWVSQNSGKPGSDGATLRVRGWGTLNNSSPLVIIDGIEGSFNQLNPNDIESISVLKDAASAAIFGSKAANGVILVTTKMGKKDQKMQVNFNGYYGLQSLGRRFDMIDNSVEYMEMYNSALANEGSSPLFPDYLIEAFRTGNDQYKYPNANYFDELFQVNPIQEYNLSFKGGSNNTSSFLSFNYLSQEGMIPNTNSNRYGIRANIESNVNDWLTVSGRINYTRRISEEPYEDITYGSLGRVFAMLQGVTPFTAPYTRDGRFGSVEAIDNTGSFLYDNRNPLIDAANGLTTREQNYLVLNASVGVQLHKNLLWKTTISSTSNWNLTDSYNESVFGYTDSGIETTTKNFNREGLEINRGQVSTIENNTFSTLNYNQKIGGIHDISAIAGIQMQDQVIKNVYSRRTNAPKEGLTQVDAGTSGIQGEGNMVGIKIYSYFGRLGYSLSDKYLFEANLRADASSRFAEGNRWGIFPGFSAGWRVIDEGFMPASSTLSNLKLRASWGQLGNQNISGYWPYLTVINQNNELSYSYNGTFSPGAAVTSLVDENITWETTTTIDFGADFGFFDDKVNLVFDYFKKRTSDIIVQLPIPSVLGGLSAPYENVGEMYNTGLEFALNYNNQKLNRDDFAYDLGVNLTYVTNEVTSFRGGDSPDQLFLIREGYSYNTLYGFKAIGIYQSDQEALDHMSNNSFKPQAGNLKFEDLNNDGRLGFEDKQDLGNTIPKFTYGFSGSIKYRGFDLNMLFQGLAKLHVYTQSAFTNVTVDNPTITTKWRDAWTPENTDTDIPALRLNSSWDNQQSSFWVHEVSFLKLKNIQLGYSLPENVLEALGVQKLYVYANAQNVFTLVDQAYEGYDPERSTFNAGQNMYPVPRIVSLGLNLNF